MKDPALPPSEGEGNMTPARAAWRVSLSERARAALDEDERYFLRQSLSTPCLTRDRAGGGRGADRHRRATHPRLPRQQRAPAGTRPSARDRGDRARNGDPAVQPAPLRQRDGNHAGAPSRCSSGSSARRSARPRRAEQRGVGRQKRWPPAAQSRSASLPMGHQPQPRLRRPFWENDANGGSVPAKSSPRCSSSRT